MYGTSPHIRIFGALLVGVTLVGSAFYLRAEKEERIRAAQLAVVQESSRSYVPVTDTNQNNIPDWQESLIRTTQSRHIPEPQGNWQPATLTEGVSVVLFENLVRNQMRGPVARDSEELAGATANVVRQFAKDELYTSGNLTITASNDQATLRRYGNDVAQTILNYPTESEPEMIILERALRDDQPEELEKLNPILRDYRGMIVEMRQITVPQRYVNEHLALLNSYLAVANDIEAMKMVYEDPMYSLVRMKRYEQDVLGMAASMTTIFEKLVKTDSVQFTPNDSLMQLVAHYQPQ